MATEKEKYSEKGGRNRSLNLPDTPLRLRLNDGGQEVFDPLRKKWVAFTPEEEVRQLFTAWLISHKGYPAGLTGNEISLKLNGMTRRCDTIIYDRSLKPIAIVEYKAPTVNITQSTFDQIARYNMVIKARILIVSNGLAHYCCRFSDNGNYEFLQQIPDYNEI